MLVYGIIILRKEKLLATFSFCTTFHQAGYDRYARNHIHYFDQALPEGVNHYAYAQETNVDKEVTGYKEYKEKYTGKKPRDKQYKSFEYEHVRFSHKVYAVLSHYENRKDDARYIGWIDGDVVPVKAIPLEFFQTLVKEGHFMSLLERGYKYAECGFMIWDTTLPETKEYFKRIRAMYDEGLMFEKYNDLGWHDSIIWDHEMREMALALQKSRSKDDYCFSNEFKSRMSDLIKIIYDSWYFDDSITEKQLEKITNNFGYYLLANQISTQ